MRSGKVVELKSNQVTVHEDGTRSHWKLSYAGIDPGSSDERIESPSPSVNQAPVHKPGPEDFRRGDKVSFTDKYESKRAGSCVLLVPLLALLCWRPLVSWWTRSLPLQINSTRGCSSDYYSEAPRDRCGFGR